MTYQTPSETFAPYAAAPVTFVRRVLSALGSVISSFGQSLLKATEASSRIGQVEALQAKSDEELAALGINREGIVHYVFGDLYYT